MKTLSNGRPFAVLIKKPIVSKDSFTDVVQLHYTRLLKSLFTRSMKLILLNVKFWNYSTVFRNLLSRSSRSKTKKYNCLILSDTNLPRFYNNEQMVLITQLTPTRVLLSRTNKVRKRKLLNISMTSILPNIGLVRLESEAGTGPEKLSIRIICQGICSW